ncbi:helix-turn-helix domain-containing protein [Acetobacterium woodii]|uniref:helix-turn-helix domain-containing protein n=1 Tax=Acetobacterium woodii TaxID=33952 RepID=UPI00145F05B9|nr:helix-turn-helix transcriptional regulator [Acetobacterium woodii]
MSERLRKLRENSNLTQKDAAGIFDISRERYNQYETGKRRPDYDTLIIFADYFNVSTDYLLGRTDYSETPNYQEILIPTLTENEQELLVLFRNVKNEKEQYKLIGRFEEIISQMTGDFKSNNAQSTLSKKNVG